MERFRSHGFVFSTRQLDRVGASIVRTFAEVGFGGPPIGTFPRVAVIVGPLVHLTEDGLVPRFLLPPVKYDVVNVERRDLIGAAGILAAGRPGHAAAARAPSWRAAPVSSSPLATDSANPGPT